MVKLTPDLIQQSMQFINPVRDRELDLRGKLQYLRYGENCPGTRGLVVTLSRNFVSLAVMTGYKIPVIENMGATLDQFDTIDLSDNDIRKLDGFPLLKRLKCLLLNNNRVV
uniref:Uncharacterized protein n=1 Tax=Timema poppense TaxID=170557 RepID=A0A7R9HCF8_TIMPO|nr:unnamed protein product [Timema poppensis]